MSELSFLIDLLLNQRLSKPVKALISDRIKEIEARPRNSAVGQQIYTQPAAVIPAHLLGQAPSTIANFLKSEVSSADPVSPTPHADEAQVIATTPAARAALQHRREAIMNGTRDKPEVGRTSPRKF